MRKCLLILIVFTVISIGYFALILFVSAAAASEARFEALHHGLTVEGTVGAIHLFASMVRDAAIAAAVLETLWLIVGIVMFQRLWEPSRAAKEHSKDE